MSLKNKDGWRLKKETGGREPRGFDGFETGRIRKLFRALLRVRVGFQTELFASASKRRTPFRTMTIKS